MTQPFNSLFIALLFVLLPNQRLMANKCPTTLERFYLKAFYKPNEAWARIMQRAVEVGLEHLQNHPRTSLQNILKVMIDYAQPNLKIRAYSGTISSDQQINSENHALLFGVLRKGGQRGTAIYNQKPMSAFKELATTNLKRFGKETVENGVFGPAGKDYGKPYKINHHDWQHQYDTPSGRINLCTVSSEWYESHSIKSITVPYGSVSITSPTIDVIPQMLEAANQVFIKLRTLKTKIDQGKVQKDAATLKEVIDSVAEIEWILSQTWPYGRGSGGIADLTTKVIFDWFGINTPVFKVNTNPNIVALITPLAEFQQSYPTLFRKKPNWNYPD